MKLNARLNLKQQYENMHKKKRHKLLSVIKICFPIINSVLAPSVAILFVCFMRVCQGEMLAQEERVVQAETQGENGKRHFLPKLVVQRGWFIIMA